VDRLILPQATANLTSFSIYAKSEIRIPKSEIKICVIVDILGSLNIHPNLHVTRHRGEAGFIVTRLKPQTALYLS